MAEYRTDHMMSRRPYPRYAAGMNQRPAMPAQRPGYGNREPEPVCPPEKPVNKVKADKYEIGMAYVPWQKWKETYELEQAFMSGTIFPELDKKFYYAGGGR